MLQAIQASTYRSSAPIVRSAQTRRFSRDGVCHFRGALSAATVERLREAVDAAIAKPTPLGHRFESASGAFYSDMFLSHAFSAFEDFARRAPAVGLAAEAMGQPSLRLFTDELLVKEPNTPTETPWHHDLTYWPLAGDAIASLWIPLDKVDGETGALEFVRGSHRWSERFHPRDFATGDGRVTSEGERPLDDETLTRAGARRVLIPADPGDMILFHGLTLHRASGNLHGTHRRRAVVLRLAGPNVLFDPRPRTLPLLWAPRLAPGDPLGGELFPQVWPQEP